MKKGLIAISSALLFLFIVTPSPAATTNIVKIGGDITIDAGKQVKHALAIGGQITVNGTVEGSAVAIGGSVVLTKTAVVEGNVISVGGVIVMGKGARVGGELREINASDISASLSTVLNEDWNGWSWVFAILSLLIFIGILLLACLLVALLPKPVCLVSGAIKGSPFKSFLWGMVVLISVVPLMVLLTISVLGIVMIPLEMALVVGSSLVGFIAVAQLTGEKVFALLKKKDQSVLVDVFWGLIILWFIGWIPHAGWMVKVIAVVIGLGGVFVASLSFRQQWKKTHIHKEEIDGGGGAIS
jgi:hypothetical protein